MVISYMHHAETQTHKYTDLNLDFEIFWLKKRIDQSLQMHIVAWVW